MKVLGIDTATKVASVAVVEDGDLVCEQRSPHASGEAGAGRANHAEIVFSLLEDILKRAALSLDEIAGIAVSIGPGSFTGLRIGLSTVKGLAYQSGIPVAGVSTLSASAFRATDWEGLVCPVLDARKKEIYRALFRRSGKRFERLTEDSVGLPESWFAALADRAEDGERILFVGDGVARYGESIRSALGDRAVLALGEAYPSVAFAAAFLGEKRLGDSDEDPIGPLEPIYLRPSEAELRRP